MENSNTEQAFQHLRETFGKRHGKVFASNFGAAIKQNLGQLVEMNQKERATWFSEAAHRYGVHKDKDLNLVAFYFAASPDQFAEWENSKLTNDLEILIENPDLVRSARLMKLLIDRAASESD